MKFTGVRVPKHEKERYRAERRKVKAARKAALRNAKLATGEKGAPIDWSGMPSHG
jgi:hypothetical protein